jgi:GT2 family glycosyltransferase
MPAPSPSLPPITVSIVSHGQLALIRPLLGQLDRFSGASTAKVVLTLNIPEPDVLAGQEWGFPVERIENAQPKGFGANHNQAFQHCETPWFLVLNPDIRFDGDVLAPLIAQAAPDAGLLTPRILEPGKSTPEQHREIITPLEIVTRRKPGYERPAVPAWIPGLFMLFRSDAYRRALLHVRGRFRHLCPDATRGLEAAGGGRPAGAPRGAACQPQQQKASVLARDQLAEGVDFGSVLAVQAAQGEHPLS